MEKKGIIVNERIRAKEVRVIDPDGKNLGVFPIKEALKIAKDYELDLVEVAPLSNPPVCRILNYGKYKYQQDKKAHEAKKRQSTVHVKEVKIGIKTGVHDLEFKLRHIRKFLEEKNKTKISVVFRGREMLHTESGKNILNMIAEKLEDIGIIEQYPKLEGRNMTMMVAPKN